MADPARARKVADRIKVVVAETLEHRVKDERLGFTTITDVRVTGDLDLASLRREKDDVTEVREGFECGLVLRNFQDIKIGDFVEAFEMREIPRG